MRGKNQQMRNLIRSKILHRLVLSALLLSASSQATQLVVYPLPESHLDQRANYYVDLLQLCASRSNGQIQLQASAFHAQQGRNLRLLEQNKGVDVVWTLSSEERERKFLPIRIPLDRGLLGWRLLLIKERDSARFTTVHNNSDLAALWAGQGHDWPDLEIMQKNGFKTAASSSYDGLFTMLARDHIQYFPRSILEVWPELKSHESLSLTIAPSLVLHYPSALYFFVNKNNVGLAKQLESCLETAIIDGSFRRLFEHYFGAAIDQANLSDKTVIHISNPLLPAATPLSRQGLWFSPKEKR